MLSDRPIGYVDLRSPAGAGLGALVYNYDGSVFASDEGRMLAETGDNAFRLGDVGEDSYSSLILSDKLIGAISSSLTQCAPECSTCAFESHCGADPVHHHATQGDAGHQFRDTDADSRRGKAAGSGWGGGRPQVEMTINPMQSASDPVGVGGRPPMSEMCQQATSYEIATS